MSPRRDDRVEDLEVVRQAEPGLTARAAMRGRTGSSAAVVAAVLVFLAAAIIKPWGSGPSSRPSSPTPVPEPSRQMIVAIPETDELADLRSNCDEPFGWRVYSREGEINGMPFRVWSSVAPATHASGPTDEAIPVVQVGPTIDGLGYCAPWTGTDAPPTDVSIRAWRLTTDRAGVRTAEPLVLVPIAPARPTPLTALYQLGAKGGGGAPSGQPTRGWPQGRFVFVARAPGWERWWAVEAGLPGGTRPPSDAGASPSDPAASPSARPTAGSSHG